MMKNLMPQTDTPDNAFHDGDPLTGELGTVVTALFMNNVQAAIRSAQAEILAVLADAGIATDVEKSDQLLAALKKTFASSHSPALQGAPTAPTQPKADNSTKLATTAHVKWVAADYAPLVNPALTGKPTAPTAAQTSNDTQLATTAFVKTALAALVANALAKKQPLDATLTALAGLAGGANRLPYFTGADTVAQTDLTQIGRDILGKTTVAAVRQYLDLTETVDCAKNALDKRTGGTVKGDIISQGTQISLKGDDRKHLGFHNQDGSVRMWLYKDKGSDGVRLNNGNDGGGEYVFHKDGGFRAPDSVHAGAARMAADGNIYGSQWGDEWLDAYLRKTFQPKGAGQAYTKEESDARYVRDVQRGAISTAGTTPNQTTDVPAGCVMVGVGMAVWGSKGTSVNRISYCPLQIYINGAWRTISDISNSK